MSLIRDKPEWLYDAMPVLYAAGGLVVGVVLRREPVALASAALLIVAAVSIVIVRKRHRRRAHDEAMERHSRHSRHSSIQAPPSRLASTTELVREMLPPRLGHADIDRQHRSLASRAATLRVAFLHGDAPADLALLADELVDSLARHLEAEDEAFRRLGVARDPALVEADHARLARATRDIEHFGVGGLTLAELVDRIAGDLAAAHLGSGHPELPSMEAALRQLRAER